MSAEQNQAALAAKVLMAGELVLDTPCLVGAGGTQTESGVDIEVLRDKDGVPYLPGTSLAGVLRAFLAADRPEEEALLFGTVQGSEDAEAGLMSAIRVSDVRLSNAETIVRDGVSLDAATGTALAHHKFDYEAVDKGAHGWFAMEISLREFHLRKNPEAAIQRLVERLLDGFAVGARTTKGFGRVHLSTLTVDRYDFQRAEDVLALLAREAGLAEGAAVQHETLKGEGARHTYAAGDFVVEADFSLVHSLIVRDYDKAQREAEERSDLLSGDRENVHLAAVMKTDSQGNYLLPGTSLRGVLRHRAGDILSRLGVEAARLEDVMGLSPQAMRERPEEKKKSRFFVDEAVFHKGSVKSASQTRNRLDRFTGGTIGTALFATKPLWGAGKAERAVTLHFGVTKAERWEAGLMLLLLRDLWQGRVAIGGEKAIGRGTLAGRGARIFYGGNTYEIPADAPVPRETAEVLAGFVKELVQQRKGAVA